MDQDIAHAFYLTPGYLIMFFFELFAEMGCQFANLRNIENSAGAQPFIFPKRLFCQLLLPGTLVVFTTNFRIQTHMDTGVWFPLLLNI